MLTLNKRLCEFVIVISCLWIVLCNGCFSDLKEDFLTYKVQQENTTEEVSPPVGQKTASVTTSDQQGKGYLKDGSTVSLGVLDGDEELKVLEKIKRLEKELNKEIKKREALEESLTEMKAAKDEIEEEFIITKRELEEVNNKLLEDINALQEKVAAAEQQSEQLEKKILDSQIAETKTEQELYKLKIERLEEEQKEP